KEEKWFHLHANERNIFYTPPKEHKSSPSQRPGANAFRGKPLAAPDFWKNYRFLWDQFLQSIGIHEPVRQARRHLRRRDSTASAARPACASSGRRNVTPPHTARAQIISASPRRL